MSKKEIDYKKVIGFMPMYIDDYGNCTKIILEESEKIYYKSAKSFLNKMCRYYFLDLNEVKKYYGRILAIKHLVPIPFDNRVFIPIKYRIPRCKNDGAMGYLDMDSIEDIRDDSGTKIILRDSRVYESIASVDTVKSHYKNGYIVKGFSDMDLREDTYNYPATKRDIEILIREVNQIKDRIK